MSSNCRDRDRRHAMRLCHRATELLGRSGRNTQGTDVCGQKREHGCQPPEVRCRSDAITGANQDDGVSDPIGKLVKYLAGFGLLAAFNRDHAIEQIAEQSALNPSRPAQQIPSDLFGTRGSCKKEKRRSGDRKKDTRDRNGVR